MCGKRYSVLALAGNFVTGAMLLSVFLIVFHISYNVTSVIRYLKTVFFRPGNSFRRSGLGSWV